MDKEAIGEGVRIAAAVVCVWLAAYGLVAFLTDLAGVF